MKAKQKVFQVKYEWLGRVEVKLVCATSEEAAAAKIKTNSPALKVLSTKWIGAQG